MAPRFLAFALALLFGSPAFAQLRFVQPTADLGEIRGGPPVQHRFEFVNDSVQPIDIIDFRLGCGCLTPMLDKRFVPPGEKGVVLMNIRTLGQPNGARTWQAHVQYRHAGKLGEALLVVAAKIRNEITIEPSILALTVETTLQQEIVINDHRLLPMKVTAISATSPAIRVKMHTSEKGITRVTLQVSRADLQKSRQEEFLDIYTDDLAYRHLQVPITLVQAQRSAVSAAPAVVEINGKGSQIVRLRGANDQVVRIENVEADHDNVKSTWASGPGNDATLKVRVESPQSGRAVLRVRFLEPQNASLSIPVVFNKE